MSYQALLCSALGDPLAPGADGLGVREVARKALPPGHVRLAVSAAGLNFADLLQVQGKYQDRPRLPFTPGAELAGTVIEVGNGVASLRVGDPVLAILPGGAFAAEAVAPAAACVVLPPGAPQADAAGLAVAYGTADLALTKTGLTSANGPSHTVLISGAGGGVGAAAVQLALAAGARVVALARGPAKAAALKSLGAQAVLDPESLPPGTKRLRDAVAALTGGPRKVTIFLDNVGGALFEEGLRCLGWGGRAGVIGFASGVIPSIPANLLLLNSLSIVGIYWGPSRLHEPALFTSSLRRLVGLLAEGKLTIPISHRVSLEDWKDGWAALAERRAFGKVLICPGGGGSKL